MGGTDHMPKLNLRSALAEYAMTKQASSEGGGWWDRMALVHNVYILNSPSSNDPSVPTRRSFTRQSWRLLAGRSQHPLPPFTHTNMKKITLRLRCGVNV